jgi:hypothetical protein
MNKHHFECGNCNVEMDYEEQFCFKCEKEGYHYCSKCETPVNKSYEHGGNLICSDCLTKIEEEEESE